MEAIRKITVALAGNPNSGKTTIFNNLTGSRQHVGNYAGVTIEKKEGECSHRGVDIRIVDLPGSYSLTAYSPEEVVARRFILEDRPDVVVCVIDASNLERNLYLAVQFMELEVPLVLNFNMMDISEARGDRLDVAHLSETLGVPIVPTVGHRRQGMSALLDCVVEAGRKKKAGIVPAYSPDLEQALRLIQSRVNGNLKGQSLPSRWLAIKLLEKDPEFARQWNGSAVMEEAKLQSARLEDKLEESAETLLAQERYDFISRTCEAAVHRESPKETLSDKADALLTHRVYGIPIFLAAMFTVFWATFNLSSLPCEWIESGIGRLAATVSSFWPAGADSPLRSLLVDGIIGGVGNVIVFLPNVIVLFLAIGLLEDSGYMPRAAFIMDRLMHRIGLHGKSSIPLLLGFGCSVPAIMATRTLENRRDRLTTMLIAPLMSCGARLPIYALIIPAFFAVQWQAPLLWSIYLIGIVLAILSAKLLKSTLFKGEAAPFVMELPPYRIPRLRDTILHVWERCAMYLRKAGTVILTISILLWALTTFPQHPADAHEGGALARAELTEPAGLVEEPADRLSNSYAGRIGRFLEPVLRPMGFDWKIGTALLGAVAAKEVFVAQMGIVYAAGEDEAPLRQRLQQNYSPLVGFCIMLFCLISAPCMATVAVTWRESGSFHWALLQFAGLTVLAYILTTAVYQVGVRAGIGI